MLSESFLRVVSRSIRSCSKVAVVYSSSSSTSGSSGSGSSCTSAMVRVRCWDDADGCCEVTVVEAFDSSACQ